jgi:HEPN domain-containing protein
MRPPEHVRRDIVNQWLQKADRDLAVAELLLDQGAAYYEALAFHCQQAGEKYLKALLTRHQVEFPRTHDIGQLLDLLGQVAADAAGSLQPLESLTPYSVAPRYPGEPLELSAAQAREAVRLARLAREIARHHLSDGH